MTRTRIKICGFTRSEDALAAVELGVDALGLVFVEKSPRHVSAEQAAEIVSALPPFVQSVGLFMNAPAEQVSVVLEICPLDLLQFHGDETPEYCESFERPYIKAVPMGGGVDPHEYAAAYRQAKGFLLDSHAAGEAGGSGKAFDWSAIPTNLGKPLILAGGLDVNNVKSSIIDVKPYAVDVSSGVEAAKGIKDAQKMAAFVEAVKEGDRINANPA